MELGLTSEKLRNDPRRIVLGVAGVSVPPTTPVRRGVGDLAEQFFASLGITEERYKSAKTELRLDPNCNCKERKEWLNKMGEWLGVNKAAEKMATWLSAI